MIDKTKLKAEAFSLGFALCGITTPEPPAHFGAYEAWVNAGRHADMHYLSTARAKAVRAKPAELLPGCKSIIILGAPYPAPPPITTSNAAQIAGYAKSTDYHNVFPPRLEALAAWITTQARRPIAWRGFSDTAPILERELAQRAGLGWIGKNSSLINPQFGSFFLLAELFIDEFIEPDPPFESNQCSTCSKCINACPTQCIQNDRTIDASRCLSYLSIENKGPIPPKLRPTIGTRIFGCDTCQTVCPWNGKIALEADQTLFPQYHDPDTLSLVKALEMDENAFRERFRHTPVLRAKRKGFLRNVAVVLGNMADPATIPTLTNCLQNESESLVRTHAAWALGCFHTPEAQIALQNALASESDPAVLNEIKAALESW